MLHRYRLLIAPLLLLLLFSNSLCSQNPPAQSKGAATLGAPAAPKKLSLLTAPKRPTERGGSWAFFRGKMDIAQESNLDPHGIAFEWAYGRRDPLPDNPRIVVHMHGSGGGKGSVLWAFAPSSRGDIEVRVQDAETYNQGWREWWQFGADGKPYPGRRIAAALEFVTQRYNVDVSGRGIVLDGPSMGGAGAVVQTMILPDPWRQTIAWSTGRVGIVMPRRVAQKSPGQYAVQPPDNARNRALWDSVDFALRAAVDPIVRGIHYRHTFSSNDQFSAGPDGNTQTEFVNLIEKNKIGGAFSWVSAGHDAVEKGVRLPDLSSFEDAAQDVSLDRAHPAFTHSTGNYPLRAAQRIDEKKFPRGHYNMGLVWNHAEIRDEPSQLVFPLRYVSRSNLGKGIPNQPEAITVSVTPRRPRHFQLQDGETLRWSWNGGQLEGTALVNKDTVTIDSIPLVSNQSFKNLRIYR